MMQGYDPLGSNPLGSSGDTYLPAEPGNFDWFATLISQYANSPVILALLGSCAEFLDPTADIERFYKLIWNVDTAQGYGLDVWGRIVGVNRILQVSTGEEYLGFDGDTEAVGFNQAPFYSGNVLTQNNALSDNAYRTLIFAKAFANITDGSVASANALLRILFPAHGNCYMRDNGDMTITWVFGVTLSPVENSIVAQSGVLPKPAGVSATISQP